MKTIEEISVSRWIRKGGSSRLWTEDAAIELTIDVPGLLRHLGAKAVNNKTGRASLLFGKIRARVLRRVERDVIEEAAP